MDRQNAQRQNDQRSNQCNPNHAKDGPGRQHEYQGATDKASLNNHGQQLNPNNERYVQKK